MLITWNIGCHTENLSTWNVVIEQSFVIVLFKYEVDRIKKLPINYEQLRTVDRNN